MADDDYVYNIYTGTNNDLVLSNGTKVQVERYLYATRRHGKSAVMSHAVDALRYSTIITPPAKNPGQLSLRYNDPTP